MARSILAMPVLIAETCAWNCWMWLLLARRRRRSSVALLTRSKPAKPAESPSAPLIMLAGYRELKELVLKMEIP